MQIETNRLLITELTVDMAQSVHENSLDDDTREFVPDEVFPTPEDANRTVAFLISMYGKTEGPLVYAVIRREDERNIGYVQLAPLENGKWEIGYHIAKAYTRNGYATEAVQAFLPVMSQLLGIREIYGISRKDNAASVRVLEKCGFEPTFSGSGAYQGERREIVKFVWKK